MNNLFSEIYGTYFRIAAKLLERPVTDEKHIRDVVSRDGFRDSLLFLPQKLIPGDEDWGLFRKNKDGLLERITRSAPVRTMSMLQKRWLKSKLNDPRIRLFMDDEAFSALNERLKDVKPLWQKDDFRYTDVFADSDDYTDEKYIKNFRSVLKAVKERRVVEVKYRSGHGNDIHGWFVMLKLEYSAKNDKFRVYCYMLHKYREAGSLIINIGRISEIRDTGRIYRQKVDMDEYFDSRRCKEPAVIRVTSERNGLERFMMEFASLEKQTVHDTGNDEYIVRLWYDKQDETELLIRLLSFGPVIEILGPDDLRRQARERVKRQYRMLDEIKKNMYN